ncbi:GxxExxY protein [Salinisphaera sp. P385]|uniref:GxxExxY protein n=1 Tax=Spectribacter acetivorans TaxID=3075603 RepID=A0ABU3B3K0_9GAMM|nr:GxxExxY protein [Salinisphaera sp. P385]MDT0617033.1 GxxExxY protein [Salinisphaera sp. P385]
MAQIVLGEHRDPQTYAILGAAMEVHRVLGPGFLEAVYQEAMALEFEARDIPCQQECRLDIRYKGQPLACSYRADFICYNEVIVEIKAIERITRNEQAQVINYLQATGAERALLINFGESSLQHRRLVLSRSRPPD